MSLFPTFISTRSRELPTGSSTDGPTSDFWYTLQGGPTASAVPVNEKTALRYITVFACVSLIAGDVGRLPLILYRHLSGGGKERAREHPLYDLMHTAPNDEMSSLNYREAAEGHCLLWGNHYSPIYRNKYTGVVTSVEPIDFPGAVEVKRAVGTKKLVYRWRDASGLHHVRNKDQMLHIPGFGFNGLKGLSMIGLAREAIGVGLAAEEFGARYFGNGTHPSGMISLDKDLGDKEGDYKKALKEQYAGLGKSHGLMVFQNGEKYESFTIPLEDAQFLQTRDHQKTEICGMYHVPPHKIALHGANSNYNNLEQENQGYVDSCLMHWLIRWEQCLNQQLLTKEERKQGLFFEFLVDGMLRGDAVSRADYYTKMLASGAISPNDIRAKENMNPIDGGDQYFVPLNYVDLKSAGDPAPKKQQNARRTIEHRSIRYRDRIVRQYLPLFQNAAQDIVNREKNAVKRKVEKFRKQRAVGEMESWLAEFYRDLPDYIRKKLGPVISSFSDAIRSATADEIGTDMDQSDFEQLVSDYIERYAQRHVDSSQGQLVSLLDDDINALENRVDEWSETRPEKIAANETVRGSSAIFQAVCFAAGLATVWRIRGSETCPYCRQLNGKAVSRGQAFVTNGDTLEDGDQKMKIRGTKAHPPLHQGCDCYLEVG